MTITICFKTCFEAFSKEFSEYFPKNSSRKLHLEHTRDIIDGCRFGWVEIAFVDAVISCCMNYDLKIGKRNFHQHIALVKSIQNAVVRDTTPREYHSLCKFYNSAHDVWLINILSGFESAKALYDHVVAGKDNSRAEKKSKNLTQFFSTMVRLQIYQDSTASFTKSTGLDDLAIALDKRPTSKYLCALSLALRNAIHKIPQLDLVKQNNFIKQIQKDRKNILTAEVTSSVMLLSTAAAVIEDNDNDDYGYGYDRDDENDGNDGNGDSTAGSSNNSGSSSSNSGVSTNNNSNRRKTNSLLIRHHPHHRELSKLFGQSRSLWEHMVLGQNDSLNKPSYLDSSSEQFNLPSGSDELITDYAAALVSMSHNNSNSNSSNNNNQNEITDGETTLPEDSSEFGKISASESANKRQRVSNE